MGEKTEKFIEWYREKRDYIGDSYDTVVLSTRISVRLVSTSRTLYRLFLLSLLVTPIMLILLSLIPSINSIFSDVFGFVLVIGIILIFIYVIFLFFLFINMAVGYKFNFKRGLCFVFLDSLPVIILSTYLSIIFVYFIETFEVDIFINVLARFVIIYLILIVMKFFVSYKSVPPIIHLKYAKNCIDDYVKFKDESDTLSNMKMKAYANIILTKEKLNNRFKGQYRGEYSIEWLKIENLEILAREFIWINPDDDDYIKELKQLLDEGIDIELDVSPNLASFIPYMNKITVVSKNNWSLDDKVEKQARKNLFLTIVPIIIAVINIVGIILRYYTP